MKKIFILTAAALVGMVSCSKEGPAVKPYEPVFGEATRVTLELNTSSSTRAVENGTEAESLVSSLEIYIFDDEGLVLDEKVGGNGYVPISGPEFADAIAGVNDGVYRTQVEMSAGASKQVLVIANAELGTPTQIVAALKAQGTANGSDEYDNLVVIDDPENASDMGLSLKHIMTLLAGQEMKILPVSDLNVRRVPTKGFVMTGIELNANVEANKSNNKIAVEIFRSVAKINAPVADENVTVEFDQEEFDEVFQPGVDSDDPDYVVVSDVELEKIEFELTGYAVVSGLRRSTAGFVGKKAVNDYVYQPVIVYPVDEEDGMTYVNEWDAWDAGEWTSDDANGDLSDAKGETLRGGRIQSNAAALKTAGKGIEDLAQWTGVYSGINEEATSYVLTIDGTNDPVVYVYESKPGTMEADSYVGFNADQTVALIIEGELSYDGGDVEKRYWRVNVRVNEAYHITRNSVYKTQVSTIVTPGKSTPWEAEEETEIISKPGDTISEFFISVSPWDVKPVGNGQI